MELKPGYKQTGIGMIPEDWTACTLRQKSELISKGTTPTSVGRRFVDRGVSFVKIEAITNDGQVEVSKLAYIDVQTHELLKRSQLMKDDILFSIAGALGRTAIVPQNILPANTNQAVAFVRLRKNAGLDHAFVFHYLRSESVRRHVDAINVQGAQANLSLENVRGFEVWLPLLPEQCAIAAALGDVDALLGAPTQLIAKKRDLKQAAMQQLLTGQTRLPGFRELWEERPLGSEVVGLDAGVSVNSVDNEAASHSEDLAILKTSAVENGVFLPHECKKISASDVHRARLNPRADSLLISRMNTIDLVGECGYVDADYSRLFVPDRLWMTRFRPESTVSAKWLSYVLSSAEYRQLLKAIATGTSGSMKNISKNCLLSLPIVFPGGEEQTAIATVLSDMDAELAALEQRMAKTRALKQGMMQELLTGSTRLV